MAESTKPVAVLAAPHPYKVELEPGKEYYYCTCGLSKNQPFCDGAHRAEGKFKPQKFTVTEKKDYYLCGCKETENAPFCDGMHRKEKGLKKYNTFLLEQNTNLKRRADSLEKCVYSISGVMAALVVVTVGLAVKLMRS